MYYLSSELTNSKHILDCNSNCTGQYRSYIDSPLYYVQVM